MKRGDCQELHPPYPSVYGMLGLNETASEAELAHAYEEETARLRAMDPATAAERQLLDGKLRALECAFQRSRDDTLPARVQAQYEKRGAQGVTLYSICPVGVFGLVIRFINMICGVNGWCDCCMVKCTSWLDGGCCSCSCFGDSCCLTSMYGTCVQNSVCKLSSGCDQWYENAAVVRIIDMALMLAAIIGGVVCVIKGQKDLLLRRARDAKLVASVTAALNELNEKVRQRDDIAARAVELYRSLVVYRLDVRPFMNFLASLPNVSPRYATMCKRLFQPGSFYDGVMAKYELLTSLCREANNMNMAIRNKAQEIARLNANALLPESARYDEIMNAATNGLANNTSFKAAAEFSLDL